MEVTINYNGQVVAVEVTLEVYEFLDRADHKTENLFHEQRRRFLLYALDGLSLAEIGVLCSCSKVAVYQSVEAVRKKFINFFENRLNE